MPPLAHTQATLARFLDDRGLGFEEVGPGVLATSLGPEGVRALEGLDEALSPTELRETRAMIRPEGGGLAVADLADVVSLKTLLALFRSDWLLEALREDRLTTHFQPIVFADDPGRVLAHECLLRGVSADGSLIPPGDLYAAARDADLLFQLDRAARLTAIREAKGLGLGEDSALFINFNPTSVYDPAYCLRSTFAAASAVGLCPQQIVFEIVESDHIADIPHLVRIAETYRRSGFRVALDDLGSGYGSLNLLHQIRPDFIKLDMAMVRGVGNDSFKGILVAKLLEMAREMGVQTIAEGVETESEYEWLRRHGADFLQGYLIARPASPPRRPRDAGIVRDDSAS